MAEQPDHVSKKLRSPSYPSLGLTEAVAKSKIIWERENRHAVPTEVAAKHWGYSPKSSGGRQAIASLLKYGLVDEAGANQSRTVKLTDRALRILLGSPDESKQSLQSAALEPSLHRLLWDTYQNNLPSSDTLSRFLVLEHRFNPSSVQEAIRNYKDSLEVSDLLSETMPQTGLVESPQQAPSQVPVSKGPTLFDQVFNQAFGGPALSTGPTLSPVPRPSSSQQQMPATLDGFLPIPLDCGKNALIPRGMSEDDFLILLDTLKLWKRKIVRAEWPKDAIWRNADHDQPVSITGPMGEKDGVKYFRSSTGTGIPEHELEFH